MFYYDYSTNTPLGVIRIEADEYNIYRVSFGGDCKETAVNAENAPIRECYKQISEYLVGSRREFNLPLKPTGTPFQLSVWKRLAEIPYGQTKTYKQIAAETGRPLAARAAGGACNKNPLAIVVPCHRVVGADGSLTGFAGGLPAKGFLLDLERNVNA